MNILFNWFWDNCPLGKFPPNPVLIISLPQTPTLTAGLMINSSAARPNVVRCRILVLIYWPPLQEKLWPLQEFCWIVVRCRNYGLWRIIMVCAGNSWPLQESSGRCRNLSQLSQNLVPCKKNFKFANISRNSHG